MGGGGVRVRVHQWRECLCRYRKPGGAVFPVTLTPCNCNEWNRQGLRVRVYHCVVISKASGYCLSSDFDPL